MEITFSDDGRDFVRRDWTGIADSDPSATFFHTPRYLKLYWEEFGDAVDLLLVFAVRGEETSGAVAFERSGGTLRFLGGTEVTDYMGPVARAGAHGAVATGLLAALAARDDWEEAELLGLPEDSPWIAALTEGAAAQGMSAEHDVYDVAPFLRLAGTFESYLAGLPAKLRHEIKRKSRRLETETGGYRICVATEESLGPDLDDFVRMHRSSQGPKGKFMKPGMEIFFRRLGEAFLPSGAFRLAFIEAGGKRMAGAIGFVHESTYYLYNSAFDHGWRNLSPGMVLVGELIRSSIEEGCDGFDFLKDGLEYKYRFGAEPRELVRLKLRRRTG